MEEMLFEDSRLGMERQGLDVMKDMLKIMGDKEKYAYYVDSLSEGLSIDQSKLFKTLAENSRSEFLIEANTSASLNAFAPLQPTLLRCIIPRMVTQGAINYSPLNTPVAQFGWLKPFITRPDGTKVPACDTLSTDNFYGDKIEIDIDVPSVNYQIPPVGKVLDRIYTITSVSGTLSDGTTPYTVVTDIKATPDGFLTPTKVVADASKGEEVLLYGQVDREAGTGSFTYQAVSDGTTVTSVHFVGATSQEQNSPSYDFEFEFEKDTIEVGDGEIINSSMPYSYLKDTKALYDFDAMVNATNTIGSIFARINDMRNLDMLYRNVPAVNTLTFDAAYNPMFGITRAQHNSQALERIYRLIGISDDAANLNGNVSWSILANPIDASILASSKLGFGSTDYQGDISKGGSVGGAVTFDVNTSNGVARVVSSKVVKSGEALVVPRSDDPNEIIAAYYPYSTIVLSNNEYRNANSPLISNIATLNRATRRVYRPEVLCKLNILNNNS